MTVPKGTRGEIKSRSGMSRDYGVEVGAGLVDEDYQGPVSTHYILYLLLIMIYFIGFGTVVQPRHPAFRDKC